MKHFSRECLFPSKAALRAAVFLTLLIVPEGKKKSDSQSLWVVKWPGHLEGDSTGPSFPQYVSLGCQRVCIHSFSCCACVCTELSPRWMLETECVLQSLPRECPPLDIKAQLSRVKSEWLSLGWADFALVPGTKWNKLLPMCQALC